MRKFLSKILILMTIPMLFVGCGKSTENDGDKLKVAVSISPLKEFTEIIGGDKVDIYTVVKENMEPHDFDFSPSDKKALSDRKLFIYNGLGMEGWLDQVKEGNKDTKLIDASKNGNIIVDNGVEDPHIWLSLKEATNECNNIKDALIEADPENREYYEGNYNKYKQELDLLFNEYSQKLASIKGKTFVTSHEAFAYLCRDYGLQQKAIKGIFDEEAETTFKDMESLANYCKSENIKIIFSEGSESQKDSDTLAKAINGKVVPIHTLETKVEGKSYIEAMKDNYEKIYAELK
ncbi:MULTISPECIES: zinc ABC transporter substrate-binding protein [Clostridium]|uniref:Zinc ABC transporter substrate-binding protein n=1 Tax=Clostridium cibarium TaxID=2762247 RepID=A0ABR8PR82_9CLOT|nr:MULTISPECIES: zinc ABC transporter substrate-binding protein [Clostridium]MBD7910672.1 zinc ABC transporter substrate-binding protein [Clostridium cibarium]